jgi:hypothetical protein
MSEMTAIRTLRFWVIAALAAGWLAAATLLWQTVVPDLDLVRIDPAQVFSTEHLERSARYQRFHRINWALATLVQILVLIAAVRLAPRARLRGIPGGVALGAGILVAVWVARLPFVLAAQWWRRRYGVSDAGYGTILIDPWLERIGGTVGGSSAGPRSRSSVPRSFWPSRSCSLRDYSRSVIRRSSRTSKALRGSRE